jgi:hypothetical protein
MQKCKICSILHFLYFIKIMYQNKMYIFNESSKTHEHKLQMDN